MPENNLDSIAKHIAVLNTEVGTIKIDMGKIKNDIKWLKKILGYMAALITGITITVLSAVIKYIFL